MSEILISTMYICIDKFPKELEYISHPYYTKRPTKINYMINK